jgi:Fe-Mn family superoxide dismutase
MNEINKIPLLLILVLGMVIVGIAGLAIPANAAYEAKNFDSLLGTKGFSDQLLKNHFTTYRGYVSDTNNVSNKLDTMLKAENTDTHKYLELKRMFGLKWNGMRLHEYYFENLVKGGKPIDINSALYQTIVDDFGSYENWEKDFRAVSAIRDDGWSILYYDSMYNRLFNVWIDGNDVGHLSGTVPILVMDGFTHAYKLDYGNNKANYINAFIDATDWTVVNSRFEKAC